MCASIYVVVCLCGGLSPDTIISGWSRCAGSNYLIYRLDEAESLETVGERKCLSQLMALRLISFQPL